MPNGALAPRAVAGPTEEPAPAPLTRQEAAQELSGALAQLLSGGDLGELRPRLEVLLERLPAPQRRTNRPPRGQDQE